MVKIEHSYPSQNVPKGREARLVLSFSASRDPFGGPLTLSKVHWVRPKLVAEITYLSWSQDGLLRQTVFAGLREDEVEGLLSAATRALALEFADAPWSGLPIDFDEKNFFAERASVEIRNKTRVVRKPIPHPLGQPCLQPHALAPEPLIGSTMLSLRALRKRH